VRQLGNFTEALDQRLHHHITYQLTADAGGGGSKGDRLPIAAVQAEGHARPLTVVTGNLQPVQAVPLITALNRHCAFVHAYRRTAGLALQEEFVGLGQAVHALGVNRWQAHSSAILSKALITCDGESKWPLLQNAAPPAGMSGTNALGLKKGPKHLPRRAELDN
jgi:hypothetical protein